VFKRNRGNSLIPEISVQAKNQRHHRNQQKSTVKNQRHYRNQIEVTVKKSNGKKKLHFL
jgi:hypothetical protein